MKKFFDLLTRTHAGCETIPLRITLAAIFFASGSLKLFGWFGGKGLLWIAEQFQTGLGLTPGIFWASLTASTEFFGAILILIGLFTRVSAVGFIIIMLVAIAKVHWSQGFFGFQLNLLIIAAAVSLIISGGGALSIDKWISRK